MSEDSPSRTVQKALAAVMDELPAIGKDQRAAAVEGGYAYRGIEAITRHLQPLLAKHGVIIAPLSHMVQQAPAIAMKDGWTDTILDVEWRIYGPEGDSIEARTQGIGRDKSDKGAAKALTQARKNLLLSLFSIADKADDADGQTYEHDRAETGNQSTENQVEPSAPDEHREKALAAVLALSETHQEAVKLWLKNNKVPALTKTEGGPTLTQLNELADYITQLTTEPFDTNGPPPEQRAVEPDGEATGGVPPRVADKPFEPVVFNHETGQQEPVNPAKKAREKLAGSERAGVNSSLKAP